MVSAAKFESIEINGVKGRKIHIQDIKITEPLLASSAKAVNPSTFWSAYDSTLKVKHCKANIPASPDLQHCSPIPFGLPAALNMAYTNHADIVLRPDDVWIMVCYGLSQHISLNSEKLRHLFVDHEGQKELILYRSEPFDKMDWESATEGFAGLLEKEVKGEFCKTIACDFSTSSRVDYIASMISLMTTMKYYFKYTMLCGSGIRNAIILGTLEDWNKLKEKIMMLEKYELGSWSKKLLSIVDNFIKTYNGFPDLKFWNYMVDKVDGTGGSGMRTKKSDYTGWLINFYAYTAEGYPVGDKIKPHKFPQVVLKAPVKVIDLSTSTTHNMEFLTGYTGIGYSEGQYSPQLSYAFAEKFEKQFSPYLGFTSITRNYYLRWQ